MEDAVLAAEITEVFHEHRGRYGAPRIRRALGTGERKPSKKRVARLMRDLGLRVYTPRRYRKTTDSRHTKRIAPNLLEQNFDAPAPNQVLAGDITYISTTHGWLYLAVLLDLYSRRAVGCAMSDHIDTELALKALRMAASTRPLAPSWIHHTERDCRYGSDGALKVVAYGSDPATCPVRATKDWLELSGLVQGPVFRPINRYERIGAKGLTAHAVAAIVRRTAAKAGLPVPDLSGHSLRAGFVTQAYKGGADISAIMDQTGHERVETAFGYVRRTRKWKKPASAKLGL